MPNFLSGLFETKQSPKASEAINRATGASSSGYYTGTGIGQVGGWDIDKGVRDGIEKVTWVFRCVDVIAQKQSTLPIVVRKGYDKDNGTVVEDSRLYRLLNFRANTYERSQQFRYRLSAILLLSRRGAFIEVINGRDGRPSELHILPPGTTRPIPDPIKFVSGYEVTRGDGRIDILESERVIWIKSKPHPTDPYAQLTPLMSAGMSAETDFFAHLFNRNFLANDGRPGMLVTVQGQLNYEDAQEIKRRFSGGPGSAGEVSVLEGAGIDVVDMSGTPRDVQWAELLQANKEEILMAFGVPESVMGNASGRTFDNADAERENFYVDTVMGHCDSIASGLDGLTGDMDDDTILAFDYSGVDVLQRQMIRKREEWRAEVAMGVRTIDEYFKAIGEEPWDVVGTRILWHTSGIAIAKNPDDQAAIMTLKPVGQPAEPDGSEQARLGATEGAATGMRQLNNIIGARAAMLSQKAEAHAAVRPARGRTSKANQGMGGRGRREHKSAPTDSEGDLDRSTIGRPDAEMRTHLEGQIEGIVLGWDSRQADVITERLDHVKSRKGTRHWDGVADTTEAKALNASYSVDRARWTDDLSKTMETSLRKAITREANMAARHLDSLGVLGVVEKRRKQAPGGTALSRIFGTRAASQVELSRSLEGAMAIVRSASKNQMDRVEQKISDMDASGASLRQIQAEVRRMVGQRGQWRKALAINVTTAAVEGARNAVYTQAGTLMKKTWNSEMDERTRASHVKADGQTRKMTSSFRVGRAYLQHPCDPTGPAEETANCRCYLEYEPSDSFWSLDI